MIRAHATASSSVSRCLTTNTTLSTTMRSRVTWLGAAALCRRVGGIRGRRGEREEQSGSHRQEPEQRADRVERPADPLIVRQHAEMAEQKRPIVLAPADERQLLRPR